MKRKHKRKLLIPQVTETNLDNSFVSAEQVDRAMRYIARPIPTLGNKSMAKINQEIFRRVKMPELPPHLRGAEQPKEKNRWTKLVEKVKLVLP
jgi:hypothetical protein